MALQNVKGTAAVDKVLAEYFIYLLGVKFLVQVVGDALGRIAHSLFHLCGHIYAVALLQDIAHAALARLGIYADDVGVVLPAHVVRVDGEIGHVPPGEMFFLPPLHALCNGVLVGAGEGGEHELARIRLAGTYGHACKRAVERAYVGHIFEIELGIYPLREHVHGEGDYIDVARALAVAEQRALYPVGARQKPHFGGGDAAAAVVVRVEREHDVFAVLHMLVHIFNLLRINVRHGVFHRGGQIYNRLSFSRGLPHVQNGVYHLERILGLGARERLGRILEAVVRPVALGEVL